MGMTADLANLYRRPGVLLMHEPLTIPEVAARLVATYPRIGLDPAHEDPEHFRTLKNRLADCSNPDNEHYLSGLIYRPKRGVYAKGAPSPPTDLLDSIPVDFGGEQTYRRFSGTRRAPIHPGQFRDPKVRASLTPKYEAQFARCGYCNGDMGAVWHAALCHLKPISEDPANDNVRNAFAAHHYCNWAAGDKTIGEARAILMGKEPPLMRQEDAREADKAIERGLAAG